MSATTLTMASTHGADPLIAMWVRYSRKRIKVGVERSCCFILMDIECGDMAATEPLPRKKLWSIRLLWGIAALAALGFLAKATPGPSLDVMGAPLLSLAVVAVLAAAYPWLKNRFGLSKE